MLNDVSALVAQGRPAEAALAEIYSRMRGEVVATLLSGVTRRRARIVETTIAPLPPPLGPDFHCDAGLGGVARWLRAAGYDAAFWPGIDDDDLLRKVIPGGAVLLTSDRRMVERGVIASGALAALLTPIHLKKLDQFGFVRDQLQLPLKAARCMSCGGRLSPVAKEAVRERIPPRTYPWLDDYYLCERCGRLFWQGTHWRRIQEGLRRGWI